MKVKYIIKSKNIVVSSQTLHFSNAKQLQTFAKELTKIKDTSKLNHSIVL